MVTWHEHAILWHVYPLGFVGAEAVQPRGAQPVHRLTQLTAWLDYAVELGVSGILLGPVFSSSSHGYDTLDHLTIDPRLGDRDDFDALVREAHARGLKVVLDGVFNHVGVNHPLFRRALEGGPDAPESRLFRLTWNGDGEPDYADFEGHRGLVALDHDAPEVAELVREVMDHWLRAGADGWRLDAAYAVPPSFWRQVLPPLREAHPEMYVVGEVIHGDYAGIVAESGMDSVTQYELWKAIWSAIEERNLWELDHALGRHAAMIETFAPLTFVGNHDVTRIATRLTDRRHLPHALVVLMTVGGTPTIYYGDEQAFEGLKEERLGGDDAIRPAFPASPVELAPEGWPAYHLHQELVSLRRRHPWLHRARTQRLALENELLAYESVGAGGRLVVVLNLADDAATAPAPGTTEVLAGQGDLRGGEVTVPVHGWCVLG